jgi:tRNA threonylcarbamoyladenosine modification (KEOPS) complex  Pcc1 subunit
MVKPVTLDAYMRAKRCILNCIIEDLAIFRSAVAYSALILLKVVLSVFFR